MHCGSKYTPELKLRGYPDDIRRKAIPIYVDGVNLLRIGRHLGLHHRTVSLWVNAHDVRLPEVPLLEDVKFTEMDELFTLFFRNQKTESTSLHS